MKVVIGPHLIDSTYRHLHHAKICETLEAARVHFLESKGVTIRQLVSQGILPVLSRLDLKFLREIKEGEFDVACEDPKIEGGVFSTRQVIRNAKGKVCVEAVAEVRFLYTATKRAGVPPFTL